MEYYPFDQQQCKVVLVNRGNAKKNVQLIADGLVYNGPTDMLQYYIETPTFIATENNTLVVKINLGRRMVNVILNTFLPTILIVLVSWYYTWAHKCSHLCSSDFTTNCVYVNVLSPIVD